MTIGLHEESVHCPWCGEGLQILIDTSAGDQSYVEDCQVCCRPMIVNCRVENGEVVDVQVHCE